MKDVINYDLFAFYTNSNVYIYNYSNIDKELNKLKVQQNKNRLELQDTKKELNNTKKELKGLKSLMKLLLEKLDLKDLGEI